MRSVRQNQRKMRTSRLAAHLARSLLECPKGVPTEIGNLDSVAPLFASGRQRGMHLLQPCIVCGDKLTRRHHEKVSVTHSGIVIIPSNGPEDVDAHKILAQKPNQTGVNVDQKVTDVRVRCDRHFSNLLDRRGASASGRRVTAQRQIVEVRVGRVGQDLVRTRFVGELFVRQSCGCSPRPASAVITRLRLGPPRSVVDLVG